jgi:hypothetical protein
MLVGAVGGLIVGMTSVGSGSLIIIAPMSLYPTRRASELVGTDLVQTVPLVASAAIGHIIFGDLQLNVTGALRTRRADMDSAPPRARIPGTAPSRDDSGHRRRSNRATPASADH